MSHLQLRPGGLTLAQLLEKPCTEIQFLCYENIIYTRIDVGDSTSRLMVKRDQRFLYWWDIGRTRLQYPLMKFPTNLISPSDMSSLPCEYVLGGPPADVITDGLSSACRRPPVTVPSLTLYVSQPPANVIITGHSLACLCASH